MATATTLIKPLPGSVRRRVFDLALPAVGEQVLNMAVGLTDIYLVGNLSLRAADQLGYSSATALAGAGLGNQMVWLVTVFFIALGIGGTALVARAVGAGNHADVQRIVRQSMLIGLAFGLSVTVVMLVGVEHFLRLLGASDEVLPLGAQYVHIIALTLIPAALLFVGNACLRGAGDTRTPLYAMIGVNGTNILLSWLLVNGNLGFPTLGVAGAAIGAAIGRGGGGIVLVALLLRGRSGLRLEPDLRPDPVTLRRLINVGLPSAGEQLVFQGALLIFTRFVTGLGMVAYAAHNVTITIESLSFLPGLGYAAAASTLVGQALGARSPREAEDMTYEALWQGGLMMTLAGVIMACFPGHILSVFINDPAVIEAATPALRAGGLVQPALAVSFILLGGLRGAGDTHWPLYSRMMTNWAVRLPLTFWLVGIMGAGLEGIWLAMCTDFTLQSLLALWRFSAGRWKHLEV